MDVSDLLSVCNRESRERIAFLSDSLFVTTGFLGLACEKPLNEEKTATNNTIKGVNLIILRISI